MRRGGVRIAPSLLSADASRLGEEVRRLEAAGADWLHIDVFDAHFAPNLSFGPHTVRDLRGHSELFFDVHLMMSHPMEYLPRFAEAGANEITIHVEAEQPVDELLDEIRTLGCRIGLSLVPSTPPDKVFPYLDSVHLVLPMTVVPGFSGQKFMAEVVPNIATISSEIARRKLDVEIQADGGVSVDTIGSLVDAGVTVFVAGSAVVAKPDAAEAINDLRHAATRT